MQIVNVVPFADMAADPGSNLWPLQHVAACIDLHE